MKFWLWFMAFAAGVVLLLAVIAAAFITNQGVGVTILAYSSPALAGGIYFMWECYKCARWGIIA